MNQAKIYVGNLSYSTTSEGLRTLFGECGTIVDLKLITDRETGRSKGFAFISFETDASAESSLKLNGHMLDGRQIKVSIAKEERSGDRGGFRGGRSGGHHGGHGNGGHGGFQRRQHQ